VKWRNIAMNLREILGMQPVRKPMSEHEILARRLIRQLTLLGYSAYDVWEIMNQVENYALAAQEHPDLFPPNQRPQKISLTT